ncbi:MAG: cation transporter [Gammaproteobacteria bacterium RIFCSPHIGHO2_12_FULL_41_15]|nr:MAG: cation transporter [Gammaproteobacteria bacterium RIFCSPHIGHO2_12_FULL_41_15]
MHDHSHQSTPVKVLTFAILITFGFAIVEAIGGYVAHSLALISDAGHMVTDSFTLIIAAIAAWLSTKPPSKKHSFGLGRAEIMGAWISSFIMLILCLMIVIEAILRIQTPTPVSSVPVMVIGAIGMGINLFVAWILSRTEQNLNTRAAMLHVMSDLLGSIAALAAGVIIYFTHWSPIDPILSILISVLIFFSSMRLLKESLSVLMEGVPKHISLPLLTEKIVGHPQVSDMHDLHVWNLSSGQVLLTAHIDIEQLDTWPTTLQQLRIILRDEFLIEHVTLQPELIVHPITFSKHPLNQKKK